MITSRLRTTVSRVIQDSRLYVRVASKLGHLIFLQEVMSLGKQSSSSSMAFFIRKRERGRSCTILAGFWSGLFVISLIYIYHLSPPMQKFNVFRRSKTKDRKQNTKIKQTKRHSDHILPFWPLAPPTVTLKVTLHTAISWLEFSIGKHQYAP